MQFRFISGFSLLLLCALPMQVGAQAVAFYSVRSRVLAEQSFQIWQNVVTTTSGSNRTMAAPSTWNSKERAAAKQAAVSEYLSKVVPTMKISREVAHIPREHPIVVEAGDSDEKWVRAYAKARNGLRPQVEYAWKSNVMRVGTTVTLSPEHTATLRDNYDVLMWYRKELAEQTAEETAEQKHVGARYFQLFLDYIIADILEGLPSTPRFSLHKGGISLPEWELNERNLREQVVMANRYLIAKYLIYPEYEEFSPADRELLTSLFKISFLLGCRLDSEWFDEMEVPLNNPNPKTKWKKPIYNALAVLEAKGNESNMTTEEKLNSPARYEEACIIKIPPPKPKAKPKPRPAPPAPKPPEHKIEIIVR